MGGKPTIRSIELIANTASGSVGAAAPDEARAILAEHGARASVCVPENGDVAGCLQAAIDRGPDLLIVLAGDGTARAAAQLCGPKGPLIAPLPGGTMNMLPKAIYGTTDWKQALRATLEDGEESVIGGGEVDGRLFLVAAILGSGALLAPAREAVREGRPIIAFHRARRAWRRAFSGRLRYSLDAACGISLERSRARPASTGDCRSFTAAMCLRPSKDRTRPRVRDRTWPTSGL